jgi:hypothetical protein
MTVRGIALAAVAGVAAATTMTALAPAPAEAASSVRIYRIYYNSPGSDTRTNTSLNAEYVQIKNYSSTAKYVTGWTVKDRTGYTYTFPTTKIAAGATVVLHTGKGTNSGAHRYWQRGGYVWNNDTDTAYLRTSSGTLVSSCAYNNATVAYTYC